MSHTLRKRRINRNVQPRHQAHLNLDGFCRDVGLVYLPAFGYVDFADKVAIPTTTALTQTARDDKVGGYPTSGTGYANTGPTNFSLGYTLFAVCSASGTAYEAIMDDDLGGTRGFQFRFTNTGAINFIPFTNSDGFVSVASSNYTAAELAAGVPVVARVDASGNIAVFGKGGKFTGSLGAAPRIPGNYGLNPGVRFFRSKLNLYSLTKPLFMAGALNRVVSDVEAFAFLENPWKQVFAPQQRRIWVPSAGGASTNLVIADALHAHSADNVTLTAQVALAIADALHAHSADNVTLTAQVALAVADAAHAHMADGVAITVEQVLAVADALHAHSVDNATLTAQAALAIADALHAHSADNTTLSASGSVALAVADALHAHSADSVTLTAQVALAIADALHAHSADNVALTAQVALAIADALHAHSADNVVLSDVPSLSVADTAHAHNAESLSLTTDSMLAVADAVHAHLADNVGLSYAAVLAVIEAIHAHSADNVVLNFDLVAEIRNILERNAYFSRLVGKSGTFSATFGKSARF